MTDFGKEPDNSSKPDLFDELDRRERKRPSAWPLILVLAIIYLLLAMIINRLVFFLRPKSAGLSIPKIQTSVDDLKNRGQEFTGDLKEKATEATVQKLESVVDQATEKAEEEVKEDLSESVRSGRRSVEEKLKKLGEGS